MATKGTHVKTPVIQLGRIDLYEPRAYKVKSEDASKGEDKKNEPQYKVNMSFDKKRYKKFADENYKAMEAAQQKAIDDGEWDEDQTGKYAFKDADKDKVPESDTSKKKILLRDKRPELAGKYSLSAKAKEGRPPKVYYLDDMGLKHEMPDPILDFDPKDEKAKAKAEDIRRFWNKTVFEGQNAVVTYTYRPWVTNLGQGVSARLDNVLIVGGGKPAGSVAFEEDFSEDDISELLQWRRDNVPGYGGETVDETVDETTGEIIPDDEEEDEKPKRRKPRKPAEEEPKRRPSKRRKPETAEEPEDEDDSDYDDEDFDADYDEP